MEFVSRNSCYCERCGYEWFSQVEHPVRCARCRSPYWNKPKKMKSKFLEV